MRHVHDLARQYEREACRRLAILRWGPTGWHCPECGCRGGTQLSQRPRTWQCHDCGAQRSVTGKTVFAYAKISVVVLLEAFARAVYLPTVSELQLQFRVARSTAWYLLQRALKVLAHAFDSAPDVARLHHRLSVFLCATGKRPLGAGAPAWFQERQREQCGVRVPFRLDVVGGLAQLGHLGPPEHPVDPAREVPGSAPGVRGLARCFAMTLDGYRHVSLRWGPRWIAGMIVRFYLGGSIPDPELSAWVARAVRLGHAPRRRFEPWLSPGPWAAPA